MIQEKDAVQMVHFVAERASKEVFPFNGDFLPVHGPFQDIRVRSPVGIQWECQPGARKLAGDLCIETLTSEGNPAYGVRKVLPVKGSCISVPGAKPVTST